MEDEVQIKAALVFTVTGKALEEASEEYEDENFERILQAVVDKAIAVESDAKGEPQVKVEIMDGPKTLEELDGLTG